jgi:hypothetical protein
MKKTILIAFILLASTQFAFSQQAIAKIKFEEAEEAYSSTDFETTISKLNEVETILKSTNPKVMYLKIMAQSKILEKNPLNDYKIIENTRRLCTKYLKDYENVPNNEDKYRDIYKTSEALKLYSENEASFILKKQKADEAEKEHQKQLDIQQQQKEEDIKKINVEMLKPEKQRLKEMEVAIKAAEKAAMDLKKAEMKKLMGK